MATLKRHRGQQKTTTVLSRNIFFVSVITGSLKQEGTLPQVPTECVFFPELPIKNFFLFSRSNLVTCFVK
jgi:hypothetical protein